MSHTHSESRSTADEQQSRSRRLVADANAAKEYRKTLRELRRLGLSVEDMPDDVAESALVLHQNALAVWMTEHPERDFTKDTAT